MSDFKMSTHRTNWIFTREQLDGLRRKKHEKLRQCIARAIVQKQIELKPTVGNQKGMIAFYIKKLLSDPDSVHKIAGKEVLTPPLELIFLNYFIGTILYSPSWAFLPAKVKVRRGQTK